MLSSHSSIIKGQRAAHTQTHDILLFIKKRNIDEVERLLNDVSYPSSANYGKHMTHQEVVLLTSNPESYREVVEYLAAAGATITYPVPGMTWRHARVKNIELKIDPVQRAELIESAQ